MALKRRHPGDIIETTASIVALGVSDAAVIGASLTPLETARFYLETLRESARIVAETGGDVSEISGLSMLSYWDMGSADGAVAACRCALQLHAAISAKTVGGTQGLLRARIGINTGPIMIIDLGLKDFGGVMLLGDQVNLAVRLSGTNRQYFTGIIASETAVREADGRVHARELDTIRVVGSNSPATIYEVLDMSYSH